MSHTEPTRPSTGNFFEILTKAYQHKMNADQGGEVNSANQVQLANSQLNKTNSKLQSNADQAKKLNKKEKAQSNETTKHQRHLLHFEIALGVLAVVAGGIATVASGGAAAGTEVAADAVLGGVIEGGAEAGGDAAVAEAGSDAAVDATGDAVGDAAGSETGTATTAAAGEDGVLDTTEAAGNEVMTEASEGADEAAKEGETAMQKVLQNAKAVMDRVVPQPVQSAAKYVAGAASAGLLITNTVNTMATNSKTNAESGKNASALAGLNTNTEVQSNNAQVETNNASQQFTVGVQTPMQADTAAGSQFAQEVQMIPQMLSVG